jgi:tRNA threonylcarbamoyl adenosine modification protein (Sua5/YciO/YrdC/YwlC family)
MSLTDPAVSKLLSEGAVGVLPGDTVYGVMCRADNPEACSRLYAAKQRENKPGTVIAANVDQLVELGLKKRYLTPVEQYWPGAISVIIPCGPELSYMHQGKQGLAVRVPDDPQLLELLQTTGPLLTSSANITGQPTAVTVEEAQQYFGGTVDFYVDGGDLSDRLPSTIVRVVDDAIEVIRQGAVTID